MSAQTATSGAFHLLRNGKSVSNRAARWAAAHMPKQPVIQGVLANFKITAVNKPTAITSVDVLRTLQNHFNPSALFAPLISEAADAESRKPFKQRNRRNRSHPERIKIGHGGTLDPLATGVLLVGLGSGTKSLSSFLACKKTYETVVVFGVASDSYDVLGNITNRTGWDGVSKEKVKDALAQFKGSIKQKPPVYSAKWINGERSYDIARRGETIPEGALQEKELQVDEIELLDYWEEGQHQWVMRSGEVLHTSQTAAKRDEYGGRKRKRVSAKSDSPDPPSKTTKNEDTDYVTKRPDRDPRDVEAGDELVMSGALPIPDVTSTETVDSLDQTAPEKEIEDVVKLGPAARIRMTVSSGFYVRSLCHDLGKALGSSGVMAELVRSHQAEFELGKNVLDYGDLEKGEQIWGPKVRTLLEQWQESNNMAGREKQFNKN